MRAAVVFTLGACYAPSATTGAPCDERLVCPSDQTCVGGRCQRDGTEIDAAIASDTPPDAFVGWRAPTVVGLPGTGKSDPSFTPDRLTVAYVRDEDIMLAKRLALGEPFTVEELGPLSSAMDDKSPEITTDGRTIYFASDRDGNYDIFMSTLFLTTWTPAMKVPAWATPSNELDLAISPDELTAIIAIGNTLRRSTRASKTAAWPAPVAIPGVSFGVSPTAPSLNAAGDIYFHAGQPRDLFVARAQGASYAAPVPLTELNTAAGREAGPFISAGDSHLWFERNGELVESSR